MRIKRKKESAIQNFEDFLKSNNCTYTINKEDNATMISFEFQAANFIATVRQQDDCVEVTYPCIASAPMSQLELVRAKCNDRNNSNILFKFSYTIDHEQNEVNVHISFFNNNINPEEIRHELGAAFHFQREWIKDFDEAIDLSKNYGTNDLESEMYNQQREMYLLRRLEMRNQANATVADMAIGTGPLTLWQMIEAVSPLPQCQLLFMTVNTVTGQQRLESEQEIRDFDLRSALVEGKGKQARLVRDYAVLDLHYKQGLDKKPYLMTITLTAEGEDEHSIYSRVTVTRVPRNASRVNSLSNEKRRPHSVSMLIALDRTTDNQHQQEFEYMWTDAQLKAKNNEMADMTEEQRMLSQVHSADTAYNLYWGRQLLQSERYYEAILHLENVFNSLRADFFNMTPDRKKLFIETAYMIGFCYNELGLYKLAFYYLDLLANDGNIRHTMEMINSMVDNKDLRLFSYTEEVMDEVKRNFNEDDLPDNIRDFINFLRRRRGHAFIDFNQLDKAERIFTDMLDENENADYAINELAHIKRLREQRGEVEKPEVKGPKPDLPF